MFSHRLKTILVSEVKPQNAHSSIMCVCVLIEAHAKQRTNILPLLFWKFQTKLCKGVVISIVKTAHLTDKRRLFSSTQKISTCAACKHCNEEVLQPCWHDLRHTQLCLTSAGLSALLLKICWRTYQNVWNMQSIELQESQ